MKHLAHLVVAVVAVLLVAADEKKPAQDADSEKIQGIWKMTEIQENGQTIKPPVEMTFTFDQDTVDQRFGDRSRKSKYKIDASKNPKHIDVISERGGETRVFKMIYSLDGDTLKICGKRPPNERPSELSSKDGNSITVFQRVQQ